MIFLALIYLSFISLGLSDSLLGSTWPIMNMELGVPVGNAGYISGIVSSGTILSSLFFYRLIRRFGTGRGKSGILAPLRAKGAPFAMLAFFFIRRLKAL